MMISNHELLENQLNELIADSFPGNLSTSINALEAACQILDNKFGKDFHKKNPKLAVRFAQSIMQNTRMNEFNNALQNAIGEYLDTFKEAILHKDSRIKETIFEDYADSFRF